LDAGLLGLALHRTEEAEGLFRQAAAATFYQANPFPRVMVGRAQLEGGKVESAALEYEEALRMAQTTGDPTLVFRIRHAYYQDLFDHGYVEEALRVQEPSLESDYLVERVWAVSHAVDYWWCKQDTEKVQAYTNELEYLLTVTEPRADVMWERNRVRYGEKVLARVQGALAGDPVKQMIMDEESLEYEYQAKHRDVVVARLKPWVEKYPMTDYATWGDDLQEWATWVHWTYNISLCGTGHPVEAAEGLKALIDNMPFEHCPLRLVNAWCWLGHCLGMQQRYSEAVQALETGLTMDVAQANAEATGMPIDPLQPRVQGGRVKPTWRETYVDAYRKLLEYQSLGNQFEEIQSQSWRERNVASE